MKRLLTHSQLKHTKQAANKFLTCFIAAIMAVALSLPAAGIPTLSLLMNRIKVQLLLRLLIWKRVTEDLLLTNKALQAMPLRVLHRQMILLMILQMEAMLLEMRAIPVMEPKTPILLRAAVSDGSCF